MSMSAHVKDFPIIYVPPRYGKLKQEVHLDKPFTPEEKLELRETFGVFLCYARAVDPTKYTVSTKLARNKQNLNP